MLCAGESLAAEQAGKLRISRGRARGRGPRAWLCCRMRLGWLGSPAHPGDKDLAVSYRTPASMSKKNRGKKIEKRQKKYHQSITTLFNTKGYPILYTVVCGYLWSI